MASAEAASALEALGRIDRHALPRYQTQGSRAQLAEDIATIRRALSPTPATGSELETVSALMYQAAKVIEATRTDRMELADALRKHAVKLGRAAAPSPASPPELTVGRVCEVAEMGGIYDAFTSAEDALTQMGHYIRGQQAEIELLRASSGAGTRIIEGWVNAGADGGRWPWLVTLMPDPDDAPCTLIIHAPPAAPVTPSAPPDVRGETPK